MKYTVGKIIKSVLTCLTIISVLDVYLNFDKIQYYCCCNINEAFNDFKESYLPSNVINYTDILVKNSFCRFGGNNADYISFQSVSREIIKQYSNYTFPFKIMSYYNNNFYCKNIWNNEQEINENFWTDKCFTISNEKIDLDILYL